MPQPDIKECKYVAWAVYNREPPANVLSNVNLNAVSPLPPVPLHSSLIGQCELLG